VLVSTEAGVYTEYGVRIRRRIPAVPGACLGAGVTLALNSHLSFRLRQQVQASGSTPTGSPAPEDSVGGSSGDVDISAS